MSKKGRNNERPISVRISSEDGDDVRHDLLRLIYIFKRLKTLGRNRSTVHRNLKKIKAQRQYRELSNLTIPRFDILNDIALEHEVQLHFWDQSLFGKIPENVHQVVPNLDYPIVNVLAPYFNEPNDFNLGELHLILDIEIFKRKTAQETQGNFWQCCEMSNFVGCEDWGQIAHYWKSDTVDLTREAAFIAFFSFGFQIFMTKRSTKNGHLSFERIHKTRLPEDKKYLSLEYVGESWPEEKTLITLEDQFILRNKDYFRVLCCPNEFCDYNTTRAFNLDRHIKTCSQDTVVQYKQTILTDQGIRKWCVENNAIEDSFHIRDFVTFDIESIGSPMNVGIGKFTTLHSLQRVISVSVTKTFGDLKNRTKVFVRKSMSEQDYSLFIAEFISYVRSLRDEFQNILPTSIASTITRLKEEIAAYKNKERNYSFQQITRFRNAINFLENLRKLRVFGFNSQSYDIPVLFSGLLVHANKFQHKLTVLKRGNQIMCLRFDGIMFVDCLNFTSGCNLDTFATMWGATISKSVFPYEKYDDIEKLANDKYWPRLLDFTSSLRPSQLMFTPNEIKEIYEYAVNEINTDEFTFLFMVQPIDGIATFNDLSVHKYPICLRTYVRMWIMYTKKINDGTFKSMVDYLKFYNAIDTEILADSFKNYVNSFIDNFQLSPIGYITLPGYAERVMYKMYDTSENKPYSFSEKYGFINKLLRENLAGGLSCVFKRHVEINCSDENFSNTVHRSKNGEKFTRLVAYDANSTYYLNNI